MVPKLSIFIKQDLRCFQWVSYLEGACGQIHDFSENNLYADWWLGLSQDVWLLMRPHGLPTYIHSTDDYRGKVMRLTLKTTVPGLLDRHKDQAQGQAQVGV